MTRSVQDESPIKWIRLVISSGATVEGKRKGESKAKGEEGRAKKRPVCKGKAYALGRTLLRSLQKGLSLCSSGGRHLVPIQSVRACMDLDTHSRDLQLQLYASGKLAGQPIIASSTVRNGRVRLMRNACLLAWFPAPSSRLPTSSPPLRQGRHCASIPVPPLWVVRVYTLPFLRLVGPVGPRSGGINRKEAQKQRNPDLRAVV